MKHRSTVTAALALAAATILTIAACGSSVTGSAQPNQAAAASAQAETSRTSETSKRTSDDLSMPTELPTDLSDLTADLSALQSILPSDLSVPSDLADLTDLSIPSDLGLDSPCLTVALAYASVGLALLPALSGTGSFDATQLQSAVTSLAAEVPSELAGDVQALSEVAQEVNGKSLIDVSTLLASDKYTTASKHIEDWVTTNCGG